MKTVRRDWLKKQIETGNMLCTCDSRFSVSKTWMPCFVGEYADHIEGQIMFFDSDFRSKSGHCWLNGDGTIVFVVHGNRSYTLKRARNMTTWRFFSPSLRKAEGYLKAACEREGLCWSMPYCPKDGQVQHAQGWYTFEAKVFEM